MINKQIAEKIALQALNEIDYNRRYKQNKISNWQKNEGLYYQKKEVREDSRANINLGRMQEFVHTLLSKIDNRLTFKFTRRKESQLKRVELLNSLKDFDSQRNYWDLKDIVGKKQAILYGRSIYSYYASSDEGYKPHLEPIDVYDFLIDPMAGGIDIEMAQNLGNYNVCLTKKQLKDGAKSGYYHKDQTNELIQGIGNSSEQTQEEINKQQRTRSNNIETNNQDTNRPDIYKFWRWFTTYEGERYYILMTNDGKWIKCELLTDIVANNKYPYWTWACFPDLTEFWTPSYADYAREIFMAQDVSINQMLDNAEAINKPQKIVDINAITDLAKLKYRRDGIIPLNKGVDAQRAIQFIQTPSINTPIQVFNLLEQIQAKASGVTDGTAGVADENGKVGIYEGNQAATADRFGLLNKSYSFGYKRFAELYEDGVKEHLVKKIAVDILGADGVEVKEVSRKELFRKGDKYSVLIESSNADLALNAQEQTAKMNFLTSQMVNPKINQEKLFEIQAKIAGFTPEEVRELQDTSEYGSQDIMSEAERDIELLLDGKQIKPNRVANNAYKQRIVDWLNDHEEDITFEQFTLISDYVRSLDPIIMKNEVRNLNNEMINQIGKNPSLAGSQEMGLNNKGGNENVSLDSNINLTPSIQNEFQT